MRPFRFGVVAAFARGGDDWAARARQAESLGYATLVVPDNLRHSLAPFPALAMAAAATQALRVGTYVLANDLRHPRLVAKDAASLDLLCGGRLELGIGAGRPSASEDYRALGVPFESGRVRLAHLAESLRTLKAELAGAVSPRPLQQPRPPILVAGSGPQLLALAAREADIVALGVAPTAPEAELADKVRIVREAAGSAARFEQLELNVNLMAVGHQVPRFVATQLGLTADDLGRAAAASALVGTPDRMCDTLQRRREQLGISYILVADELMEGLAPVVERLAGR
jgi:probable F420-dependent oxidoreductase